MLIRFVLENPFGVYDIVIFFSFSFSFFFLNFFDMSTQEGGGGGFKLVISASLCVIPTD
jgi:hypothetical protein